MASFDRYSRQIESRHNGRGQNSTRIGYDELLHLA